MNDCGLQIWHLTYYLTLQNNLCLQTGPQITQIPWHPSPLGTGRSWMRPLAVAAAPGYRGHLNMGAQNMGIWSKDYWAKGLCRKTSFSYAFLYRTAISKWCYYWHLKMYLSSFKMAAYLQVFSGNIYGKVWHWTTEFLYPTVFSERDF